MDLVATGSTLRANQLTEIATLLTSSARLVSRPRDVDASELVERLDELTLALASVVQARNQRYLMANVPRTRLHDVRGILPGIGGPDVVELLDGGDLIAVQASSPWRAFGDHRRAERSAPPASSSPDQRFIP